MKKVKIILAAVLALALMMTCLTGASAEKIPDEVGKPGDLLWQEFTKNDWSKLTELVRAEYARGIATKSDMHKGEQNFDYGKPSGEYLHAWMGAEGEYNGVPHDPVGCMVQDFTGGNSTCLLAFAMPAQWCAIIVTKESFEKNEAYTIRDAVAAQYAQAGGPNSTWGLPTSNQFWVEENGKEVLYQLFDNGYFRSVEGSPLDMLSHFYHTWDEDYNSGHPTPADGSEERPSYLPASLPEGMGDVDQNGKVDVADIMKLKALIMADRWSDEELAVGDVDESDALDVGDIMAIKNYIMRQS